MKRQKIDTPYLDTLLKEYFKNVKKYYPNFQFGSSHSCFSGKEPTSCELELRLNAKCLRGTEYEVKRKPNLIHYTSSTQNVIDILNSGYLRLNNLLNLNDPQEIKFIIKKANITGFEHLIESLKATFFSASFCRIDNDEQPDKFPMWRLYGNDGLGCAIVFELENYDSDWMNFILSTVQYGECRATRRYSEFITFHNSFQELYNSPIQNVPITLTSLLALHKNVIWKYEDEIRLLTHFNYDEYTLRSNDNDYICSLKHSISNDNKMYSYVELPLFGGKEYRSFSKPGSKEILNRLLPLMKVKEIILGYRIDSKDYFNIINVVNYISSNYGYNIGVKESHLKQDMI